MVDINQVYNTGWLKAEHLQGRDARVTIEAVSVHQFEDKKNGGTKDQLVLKFVDKELRLGLNITNAKQIAKNLGITDTAAWIGKTIIIFPTTTEMGGEMKPCIRVRPAKKPDLISTGRVPAKVETENPSDGMDDEIPF